LFIYSTTIVYIFNALTAVLYPLFTGMLYKLFRRQHVQLNLWLLRAAATTCTRHFYSWTILSVCMKNLSLLYLPSKLNF